MGLDVTHGCWSGPYSAFYRFRLGVARKAGIPLDLMDGWWPPLFWPKEPDERVKDLTTWLPLSWDLFPFRREPLSVLLGHSDCDGSIYRRHQLRLAARLEEVATLFAPREGGHSDWHEGDEPRAIYDGIGEACLRFAAGLRAAHAAHETVRFR